MHMVTTGVACPALGVGYTDGDHGGDRVGAGRGY